MVVYCISGLGADERVFAQLKLRAEMHYIYWEKPLETDNLKTYASRLVAQIDASQPFVLLGVSFGGVIARELAQLLPAAAVILISSISRPAQLSFLRRLPLLKLLLRWLPNRVLIPPRRPMAFLFGIKSARESKLFNQILKNTDPDFLRWALLQLIGLKKLPPLNGLLQLQLHGTADHIIPCPKQQELIRIPGGGHFMVYNRAEEVSGHINQFLAGLPRRGSAVDSDQ